MVQSGAVGWTVMKQKLCDQLIIHQTHYRKNFAAIAEPLTLKTTQSPQQRVADGVHAS